MSTLQELAKVNCLSYARVSTENEGQAESCGNQLKLCEAFLEAHPEYVLVETYVDDGISGATDARPQFKKMMERIQKGDIRYIIAKNEERLCRSTEVDGYVQNVCRQWGVKIIFVESNTVFDPSNREQVLFHNIKSALNQDYVHHQSVLGRVAHEQKCMAKRLNATDVRYGYYWDKENSCMAVNEEEAAVVRKMFEWYVFNGFGVNEIARKLAGEGIYGGRSGKILSANTVNSRLMDEAYKGTFYINKRGSNLNIGMSAKKKRFTRPREEWVAVPGPAIVSEELFSLAQQLREERRRVYDKSDTRSSQARFKGTHLFSGKVFCGDCGTQFHFRYADRDKSIGEYKDYFAKKHAPGAVCNNREYNRIRESDLKVLCHIAINSFLAEHESCMDNLIEIIRKAGMRAIADNTGLKACQKQLKKVESERKKNLLAWREAPSPGMKEEFLKLYEENEREKEELEAQIGRLSNTQNEVEGLEESLLNVKKQLEGLTHINAVDRNVVENFIDRITVDKDGIVRITLKFNVTYIAMLKQNREYSGEGVFQMADWPESLEAGLIGPDNGPEMLDSLPDSLLERCSDRT